MAYSLVGLEAPDFVEPAIMGDGSAGEVALSSLRGSYVYVVFYPADFSFVCPTELIEFGERLAEFEVLECRIVGISVDPLAKHSAWRQTPPDEGGVGELAYPLVSDVDVSTVAEFGVLADGGLAKRAWFLVDREGVVRHSLVNDDAIGRNVDEALRVLQAVRLTDQFGKLCPVDWEPGGRTLEPTAESVGEYLSHERGG